MEQLEDFSSYLEEFNSNYARPIATNIYESPSELFDRHLYEKGSLVLNMIRAKLGEEDFWRSINNYVNKNAFGTVETSDFARAIEDVTGISMDEFMEQWIFRPGHPELKVTYARVDEPNGKSRMVRLLVKQTQDSEPFKFDLKVNLQIKTTHMVRMLAHPARNRVFSFLSSWTHQLFTFLLTLTLNCLQR